MGFVRKATTIGTGGLARAGGVRGKSKKERNAEANEKMAKVEAKRFKAEQRAAKLELHNLAKQKSAFQTPTAGEAVAPPLTSQAPPPGWYLDPDCSSFQRWWDGTQWTDFRETSIPAGSPPSLTGHIQ